MTASLRSLVKLVSLPSVTGTIVSFLLGFLVIRLYLWLAGWSPRRPPSVLL